MRRVKRSVKCESFQGRKRQHTLSGVTRPPTAPAQQWTVYVGIQPLSTLVCNNYNHVARFHEHPTVTLRVMAGRSARARFRALPLLLFLLLASKGKCQGLLKSFGLGGESADAATGGAPLNQRQRQEETPLILRSLGRPCADGSSAQPDTTTSTPPAAPSSEAEAATMTAATANHKAPRAAYSKAATAALRELTRRNASERLRRQALANRWRLTAAQARAIGQPDAAGKMRICISPFTPEIYCKPDAPPDTYEGYQVELFTEIARHTDWLSDFRSWTFSCLDWKEMIADLQSPNGTCLVAPSALGSYDVERQSRVVDKEGE